MPWFREEMVDFVFIPYEKCFAWELIFSAVGIVVTPVVLLIMHIVSKIIKKRKK